MFRIVLFLVLIALAAWGAAWVADQPGDVVLSWGGTRIITSLPVFALMIGIVVVLGMLALGILGVLWRTPGRIRRGHHERRANRGRNAITHGLLAIGHGDAADRAPARGWLDKVTARDAALAASRQFAEETMASLAKSAQ